jgi:16S rRNA processing protein RimM
MDSLITIGKITAPHGVKGDVRVMPLTDFPERFRELKKVLLEDGTSLPIAEVKYHNQLILLKFMGLNNKNDVEPLRGKLLMVERKDAVPLPEGHYYIFDIIGLDTVTETGQYLGKVTEVLHTGSNDVYVVENAGEKPQLIPALKTVVLNIDVKSKKMLVKLQEEWE